MLTCYMSLRNVVFSVLIYETIIMGLLDYFGTTKRRYIKEVNH